MPDPRTRTARRFRPGAPSLPVVILTVAIAAIVATATGGCTFAGRNEGPDPGSDAGPGARPTLAPGESSGRDDSAIRAIESAATAAGLSGAGSPQGDFAGAGASAGGVGAGAGSRSGAWRTRVPPPPPVRFDPATAYYWTLRTDRGAMKFRLRPDLAPRHVASLLWLTRTGFYDGLTIHRVVPGFVIQGGCPNGDGRGGPGYRMKGEFHGRLGHDRPGILSAANAGPGTDGSQFFVTLQKTRGLDGRHTTFGELISGEDTLRAIERLGTASGRPRRPVRIHEARATTAPLGAAGSNPSGRSESLTGSAPGPASGSSTNPGARVLAEIDAYIEAMRIDKDHPRWRTRLPRPPRFVFPPGSRYRWRLRTSEGPIEAELRVFAAPMHASNLIYLTRLGFYDGLTLHRVVPGFIVQGGCPIGDGTGTPGYRFDLEQPGGRHDRRGLVGWANSGRPNTEGSQFYVTLGAAPHLDGGQTLIGEVIEGDATLEAIERAAQEAEGGSGPAIRILDARIYVDEAAGS